MGILSLYEWINKHFTRDKINGSVRDISSLSIDLNSLIHEIAGQAFGNDIGKAEEETARKQKRELDEREEKNIKESKEHAIVAPDTQLWHEFLLLFFGKLEDICTKLPPRDTLLLAVDGPPVWAKVVQQRERRYRQADVPRQVWQRLDKSASITCGTPFMDLLDQEIRKWIDAITTRRLIAPRRVVYSSHRQPGEGEQKIMRYAPLLEGWNNVSSTAGEPLGHHVIYGMDGDLTILALLSTVGRWVLMRNSLTDGVHIDGLRGQIVGKMADQPVQPAVRDETSERLIHDFCLLVLLCGNDFLPDTPAYRDITVALDALVATYRRHNQALTSPRSDTLPPVPASQDLSDLITAGRDTRQLDHASFSQYLQLLAEGEGSLLASARAYHFPDTILEAAVQGSVLSMDRYRDLWYSNALLPRNTGMRQLLARVLPLRLAVDDIERMVIHYLTGIEWVYSYFQSTGGSPHWYYPYFHAPLLLDLAAVSKTLLTAPPSGNPPQRITTANAHLVHPTGRITVYHVLLAVIPPSSSGVAVGPGALTSPGVIPPVLRQAYQPDSILADVFPRHTDLELRARQQQHAHAGSTIISPPPLLRIHDWLVRLAMESVEFRAMFTAPVEPTKILSIAERDRKIQENVVRQAKVERQLEAQYPQPTESRPPRGPGVVTPIIGLGRGGGRQERRGKTPYNPAPSNLGRGGGRQERRGKTPYNPAPSNLGPIVFGMPAGGVSAPNYSNVSASTQQRLDNMGVRQGEQ
jgi:hypothetical protein